MAKSGVVSTVLAVVVSVAVAGAGGYMVGARRNVAAASEPVATVNGEGISKSLVTERLLKQNGPELVSRLIDEALVNQAAKAAGVSVTQAELDARITKIKAQVGGEEQFKAAMKQYSFTEQQVRDDEEFRLKVTRILSKDKKIEDADIQKFFAENKSTFDTREVHTRHILVATEDEAKAVKAELGKGTDFAKLAKEKSIDPSAKENSGDMGFHGPGKMVAEYDSVAFSLKKGEISAPVKSQFGWHVLQLVESKGTEPSYEAMKEDVKQAYLEKMVREQLQGWMAEQRAKAKITNTMELPAAAPGGAPQGH